MNEQRQADIKRLREIADQLESDGTTDSLRLCEDLRAAADGMEQRKYDD